MKRERWIGYYWETGPNGSRRLVKTSLSNVFVIEKGAKGGPDEVKFVPLSRWDQIFRLPFLLLGRWWSSLSRSHKLKIISIIAVSASTIVGAFRVIANWESVAAQLRRWFH